MKLERTDLALLLGLLVVGATFYLRVVPDRSYGYDEADYMFAASKGLYANYVDKETIPFSQFLQLGLNEGLRIENRTALSELIRASEDTAFYRHFHGPLSFYGLAVWSSLAGTDEYSTRIISVLFAMGTIAAAYLGLFLLLGAEGRFPAVLASVFLMCSYSGIATVTQISTHGVYVLVTTIALFFLAKLLQTNRLSYGRYTVIAIVFAFAATEYAPVIVLTAAVCAFVQRRELFSEWSRAKYLKELGLIVLLFAGTMFLVWPAAWLKLTLLKNYIYNAYLALGRQGEFGTESFVEVWLQRAMNSPLEYTLLFTTTIIGFVYMRRFVWLMPFLTYGLIMLAATFRITSSSERYISSLFPPLYIVSAVVVCQLLRKLPTVWRTGVTSILLVLLLVQGYSNIEAVSIRSSQPEELDELVNYVEGLSPSEQLILATWEYVPTLHYYFPDKTFQSFRPDDEENVIARLRSASFHGVIYKSSDHAEFEQELAKHFDVEPVPVASFRESSYPVYYRLRARPSS